MKPRQEMDHKFRERSKFALLTFNNVFVDLPSGAFELFDGTLVLPAVPVPNIGIWKDWIGSIRVERLSRANLVLRVEEASENPEILDAVRSGSTRILASCSTCSTSVPASRWRTARTFCAAPPPTAYLGSAR